jgi:hypothetical protein
MAVASSGTANALLLSALLLASCASEAHESEKRREASFPGGYRIEVLKKDSYTRYQGLLTGHEYGTRHEYAYSFELWPARVAWSGGSAEPKTLVLCGEQIYLRYLDIEVEEREAGTANEQDADAQAIGPPRTMKAVARQAKLRDERTFFNLFGEARWINVEPGDVPVSADCREHAIPNDHELALGKPVLEP